jgi:hypothetical protein
VSGGAGMDNSGHCDNSLRKKQYRESRRIATISNERNFRPWTTQELRQLERDCRYECKLHIEEMSIAEEGILIPKTVDLKSGDVKHVEYDPNPSEVQGYLEKLKEAIAEIIESYKEKIRNGVLLQD